MHNLRFSLISQSFVALYDLAPCNGHVHPLRLPGFFGHIPPPLLIRLYCGASLAPRVLLILHVFSRICQDTVDIYFKKP